VVGMSSHHPPETGDGVALVVDNVTVRFKGVVALSEVSFSAKEGDIHAIIGPNGAGKSTMFNVISGVYRRRRALPRHQRAVSSAR
jgi:ABC-type branched-subunit amino acid transport system ATPase component